MSDDGLQALVIIAFIGTAFSPSYFRARRREPCEPRRFCAINAALYTPEHHRWAFTEYRDGGLDLSSHRFGLGGNSLSWEDGRLRVQVAERGAPVPRALAADVTLQPEMASSLVWPLHRNGRHYWSPIVPRARVSVRLTQPAMSWQGNGYLDSNWGEGALEDDFRGWTWLRGHGLRSTQIVFAPTPTTAQGRDEAARDRDHARLFRFERDSARLSILDPPPAAELPRTSWRIARSVASDMNHMPRLRRTLENTPFYARSLVHTRLSGEPLLVMHESLSLERFQSAWVRSLLPFRMRSSRRSWRDTAISS